MKTIECYIESLQLQAHPEGGWYCETYRSGELLPQTGLPPRFTGPRSCATAIYFLLTSATFSSLHRIKSDELWHFYAGSGMTIHVIEENGSYRALRLGADLQNGDTFQVLVPAGCWFGATVEGEENFALVGCTVAPGFDFADFELAKQDELTLLYPDHGALIARLTRD